MIQTILATVPVMFAVGFLLSGTWVFFLLALYTLTIVINLYRAKLQINNGVLIIPVPSLFVPKTTYNRIKISSIHKVHVQRMTPLASAPEKISDICWRDKIVIDGGIQLLGQFYGNLGQITQEIIQINPLIIVTYDKNNIKDNWSETDKSSLLQLTRFVVR